MRRNNSWPVVNHVLLMNTKRNMVSSSKLRLGSLHQFHRNMYNMLKIGLLNILKTLTSSIDTNYPHNIQSLNPTSGTMNLKFLTKDWMMSTRYFLMPCCKWRIILETKDLKTPSTSSLEIISSMKRNNSVIHLTFLGITARNTRRSMSSSVENLRRTMTSSMEELMRNMTDSLPQFWKSH